MNDEEQAAYDYLVAGHQAALNMGMTDSEIVHISKTNGDMPWKSICKYCDDHNEQHPDWPDCVKF